MPIPPTRLAALVLAAGAGSRFSGEPGGKLLADLHGRPVLQHVLDAVRASAPQLTIVVLGDGGDAIERAIGWAREERVRNPDPGRGLASSLQVGLSALGPIDLDGVFIVLGDQPLLRPEVLDALAEAADDAAPIILPRYAGDPGPRNPVLVLRPAWPLIEALQGDQGLGSVIAARPELVVEVPVEGRMPDVDRPSDLAALEAGPG